MPLPSLQLQPISTSHYYISGDVTIFDGVAIAPGVLIQADAHSRIVIKSGVCIGIGSILHAHAGVVEVEEGANIGAEVLLIGQVTIGANACIGSATTILNSAVAAGHVVPPGSLIGDGSRHLEELKATDTVTYPTSSAVEPASVMPAEPVASEANHPIDTGTSMDSGIKDSGTKDSGINVYGQVYVNQLLVKMFPHNTRSTSPSSTQPPLPADPWDD